MNQLGPRTRALLEAAGGGDEPSIEDQARVRAAIAARLAAGLAVAGLAATSAKSAAAAAASGGAAAGASGGVAAGVGASALVGVAAKAVVSLALVGAIGASAAVYVRSGVHPPASPPPRSSTSAVAVASPPRVPVDRGSSMPPPADVSSDRAAPIAAPAVSSLALPTAPTQTAESQVAGQRPAATTQANALGSASPAMDVHAEVLLIAEAHRALQAGNASDSLVLLDEHARRFPTGAMAEERDAARVAALCALGRVVEGRTAAAAFLRDFPGSPHASRVRASCEEGN